LQAKFIRLGEAYWGRIAENGCKDPDPSWFSFKHPTITFLQALQDAFYAIPMVMDEKLVESFYEKSVKPLEEKLIASYDQFAETDELKTQTLGLVYDFRDMLGDDKVRDLQEMLNARDDDAAGFEDPGTAIHSKLWSIVTNSRVTGFWNNQAGADSMLTRFLKAYARHRNKKIIANAPMVARVSLRQLKMYMVSIRYMTIKGSDFSVTMADVRVQFVAVTKARTVYEKNVNPRALRNVEKFARANGFINSLSCGIQLVAAVGGIQEFLKKENPTADDLVSLSASVSSAGLALTGLSDKQWARVFFTSEGSAGVIKAGVGRYLTGVGFMCSCLQASMAVSGHYRYGDEFMTTLSVIRSAMNAAGAAIWFFQGLLGAGICGPVGWAVFGALLLADAAEWIWNEKKPGTENKVDSIVRQLDTHSLMTVGDYAEVDSGKIQQVLSANSLREGTMKMVNACFYEVVYRFYLQPITKMAGEELTKIWNDTLIKHNIPFVALDARRAMPTLIANEWKREEAVKLCHSFLVSASVLQSVYDEFKANPPFQWPVGAAQQGVGTN